MYKSSLLVVIVMIAFASVQCRFQANAQGRLQAPILAPTLNRTPVLPGRVINNSVRPESAAPGQKVHKGYVSAGFLVTTTSVIQGYSIDEYKGLVEGSCVRVPTWSEDSAAGAQEVYGGAIDAYSQLCEEARVQAFNTMVARAKDLGANAIIGIHFDSQVMPLDKGKFASGVVCVGTAVVVKSKLPAN